MNIMVPETRICGYCFGDKNADGFFTRTLSLEGGYTIGVELCSPECDNLLMAEAGICICPCCGGACTYEPGEVCNRCLITQADADHREKLALQFDSSVFAQDEPPADV